MKIQDTEMETIMNEMEILSRLSLTPEEKKAAWAEMKKMLDYVEMLDGLDTEDTEPTVNVPAAELCFREDEPEESTPLEELLMNAPEKQDGWFLVPGTIV